MGQIWTAHIHYDGEDRFDITRKSGGSRGEPFVPPEEGFVQAIRLRSALEKRKLSSSAPLVDIVREAWDVYRSGYIAAMRLSYKRRRSEWDALLSLPEVTLVCYCRVPTRCHRIILASEILAKLGGSYGGEREDQRR